MTAPDDDVLRPADRARWRRWLQEHHDTSTGVWLAWRSPGRHERNLTLDDAVCEALCFGWIDSTLRSLGDGTSALRFTPRRPGSTWSASNRRRVLRLTEQGLMTAAGQRVVEAARRDGSWTALDSIDALRIPDDLAAALADAGPDARANFSAFTASDQRVALWWIESAKRPQTRAARVAETARLAAQNLLRPGGPESPEQNPPGEVSCCGGHPGVDRTGPDRTGPDRALVPVRSGAACALWGGWC